MRGLDDVAPSFLAGGLFGSRGVHRGASRGNRRPLARDHDDRDQKYDHASSHEEVPDEVQIYPRNSEAEGERHDCADDEKENSCTDTHDESFQCCLGGVNVGQ